MELSSANPILGRVRALHMNYEFQGQSCSISSRKIQCLYALTETLAGSDYLLSKIHMNDHADVDQYLREVNAQLAEGQYFIACADYLSGYQTQVFRMTEKPLKMVFRVTAFIFNRVLPKVSWGRRVHRALTGARKTRLSKTEILGRLSYAGFKIDSLQDHDKILYFRVIKRSAPLEGYVPSYGPLIRMKRMVKNGKMVNIYKLRTMHPYAEFIQDYVYEQNELAEGGKIKNDFRVSKEGSFFRKYFLDELPMFINLLKGDIKLVGVRPLSEHYFSLYTEAMQRRRRNHKPGLLPPFYSEDVKPKTIEDVMVSEMKYLIQYERNPIRTDLVYFVKICDALIRKKLRSQ